MWPWPQSYTGQKETFYEKKELVSHGQIDHTLEQYFYEVVVVVGKLWKWAQITYITKT